MLPARPPVPKFVPETGGLEHLRFEVIALFQSYLKNGVFCLNGEMYLLLEESQPTIALSFSKSPKPCRLPLQPLPRVLAVLPARPPVPTFVPETGGLEHLRFEVSARGHVI